MAAPSTFSYAQAAKGQGATPSNTQSEQELQVQPGESKAVNGHQAPEAAEHNSATETRPSVTEKTEQEVTPAAENIAIPESTRNSSRAESRRDEEVSRLDRPWRRADKGPTRSSSATTRSVDEGEHRRPRKGRKSKPSDKANGDDAATSDKKSEPEPEPQPKIELSEAPIPSVNIWQQRKESLLSKPKAPASTAPEAKVNGAAQHTEISAKPSAEATETVTTRETPATNGVKAPRKAADGARPERNASRGNRVAEKTSKTEIPPPVGDAVAWPTPETAVKDVKKTAEATDKSEKDAQEDAAQKPRSKDKWVTYDYVPTVTFETQIQRPSGGKPRGGGRGTGSGRGGHSGAQVADKAASSSSAPANKTNETKDRAREQTNGVPRNSSVPPATKQPATETAQVSKEAKKPSVQPSTEKKEASIPSTEAPVQREARSERGRGGYRGRGNHHNTNAHGQPHAGPAMSGPNFAPNGMGPRGQPYSPPPRQGAHGQMFPPPPQRGGRGGRNAGGNHYNRMSLPNSASRLPPVQTQFASYEYPMAPMTAIPYQPAPYWDNMVMTMLKQQIEYYFSIDNLCKDLFLRQRMDSQGFVPLHFILAFQRIRDMQAELAMVRAVCEESNEIDYVVGEDDCERLRRRHGWETFVLPMEDRDTGARNHGPMHPSFKSRSYNMGSPFNGMGSPPMHFPMASPHGYSAPPDQTFQPYGNGSMGISNGQEQMNGKRTNSNGATQLSANVPDFSPSGAFAAGEHGVGAPNGDLPVKADSSAMTNGHLESGLPNGVVNGVHGTEQPQAAGQA
ncbi:hypothetical protein NLU13_9208 [Sarocladium strictum]|uniref:HTH La-type RNA-binding domain-containing protein n=1 Tax=Sarocladium strictum TaxID=5046 RepID=A0AA39G9Q6_SARSR|nr:hypothetical protein NLU13_9208 [Sarocladium strictum]